MKVFATTLLVACLASFPTHAQNTHSQHMGHGAQMADVLPTEAGQAAFATMNGANGWKWTAKTVSTGTELFVETREAQKVAALGFIGTVTIGMHHQQHHWVIAKSEGSHD
jgi:hypothetical protein